MLITFCVWPEDKNGNTKLGTEIWCLTVVNPPGVTMPPEVCNLRQEEGPVGAVMVEAVEFTAKRLGFIRLHHTHCVISNLGTPGFVKRTHLRSDLYTVWSILLNLMVPWFVIDSQTGSVNSTDPRVLPLSPWRNPKFVSCHSLFSPALPRGDH